MPDTHQPLRVPVSFEMPSRPVIDEVMAGFEPWQEVAGTIVRRSRWGRPPPDLADIVVRVEMLVCTPYAGFAIHWLPQLIAGLWWQPPLTPGGEDDILWVFATPLKRVRIQTGDRPQGYGVVLCAEALPALLGAGVRRVHGMVRAEEVLDWDTAPVRACLRACPDDETRATILCEVIRQRRRQAGAWESSADTRLARLATTHPAAQGIASIEDLERFLHVGSRQLQRMFNHSLGMTPKQFLRLRRFRAVLERLLEDPDTDLVSLAATMGFSDQAHLTQEFNRLTGLSPRRLLTYPGAHLSLRFSVLVVNEAESASAPAPDHAMDTWPTKQDAARKRRGGQDRSSAGVGR